MEKNLSAVVVNKTIPFHASLFALKFITAYKEVQAYEFVDEINLYESHWAVISYSCGIVYCLYVGTSSS